MSASLLVSRSLASNSAHSACMQIDGADHHVRVGGRANQAHYQQHRTLTLALTLTGFQTDKHDSSLAYAPQQGFFSSLFSHTVATPILP